MNFQNIIKAIAANPIYKSAVVVLCALLCGIVDQAVTQLFSLPQATAIPFAGMVAVVIHNLLSKERDSLLAQGDPTMIQKITGLEYVAPTDVTTPAPTPVVETTPVDAPASTEAVKKVTPD